MKLTVSTLGSPAWTLEDTAAKARAYGFDGVDLRLLDGEVITVDSIRANADRIRDLFPAGVFPVTSLGTSIRIAVADPAAITAIDTELRAWVTVAAELGIGLIRVFGGKRPEGLDAEQSVTAAAATLERIAPDASRAGVIVGLETHDDFSSAALVARVLAKIPHPAIGAIWDLHHTYRMGETAAQVIHLFGDRLLNVHVKDAVRKGTGDSWQLVPLGEGEIPVEESLVLLANAGYPGDISIEWEKKWHPELDDPEIAFPQHIAVMRTYLNGI